MDDEREPADAAGASSEPEELRSDELDDRVQEASEESFPASDPPAWEPLHSGPPADRDREADAR